MLNQYLYGFYLSYSFYFPNLFELATIILDEVEVAAVPGEAFGPSGYLRFSYALGDEDIVEGIGRIKKLLTEG